MLKGVREFWVTMCFSCLIPLDAHTEGSGTAKKCGSHRFAHKGVCGDYSFCPVLATFHALITIFMEVDRANGAPVPLYIRVLSSSVEARIDASNTVAAFPAEG